MKFRFFCGFVALREIKQNMKKLPKILMIIAALGMLILFIFPMWRITLYAPQYPQGVTMYIWINKIGGDEPATLQNINILNHYVGMKYIEPESIPELKYFPYIIVALTVLGLVAAFSNRPKFWLYWALLVSGLALLGIYDFYLWEYEYGHNLSPDAPMKFPGASFQPPLIGTKVILNFVAESFPHTGGIGAMISILLAYLAWFLNLKNTRKNETVLSSGNVATASGSLRS